MPFTFSVGDIAFGAAVAFLFGVLAANLGWSFFIVAGAAFFALAVWIFLKKQMWKEAVIFFTVIVFGFSYYCFSLNIAALRTNLPFDKKNVTITAMVSDEPSPSEKYNIVKAAVQKPFAGEVMILAPPYREFHYGDLLKITGTIKRPDAPGDSPIIFSPKISVLARHRGFLLREKLIDLKVSILGKFNEILPEEQAALLGGIAFGSKQNFSQAFKNDMALSGTTHMVAISGYNITIIIVSVGAIFGRFFSRRITFFITILFIVFFILMSGIQASAIRAAIMGFLALLAREAGRPYDIRNSITLTGALMVMQDPTIMLNDAGFQLSFLSLLGIVYLQKPLQRLFHYHEAGFLAWKENALTTMSAQLAVMPVLVGIFGQFSAMAIGANILVLGTVPLTMFFGFALAGLGFISLGLAFLAGKIAGLLLGYQIAVIKTFAALAVPLPVSFNSAFVIIVYYSVVAIFAIIYGRHQES